jgi:hypothetical protein
MMVPGRHEDFRVATENVLRMMAGRRLADMEEKQDRVDGYVENRAERLDEIAQLYGIATAEWADLEDISQVVLQGDRIGDYGHMVLIPEGDPNGMSVGSIAEHKGEIIEKLIPEMVKQLLGSYVFDDDDDLAFEDLDVYARGTSPLIEAGQFDLDELIGSDPASGN